MKRQLELTYEVLAVPKGRPRFGRGRVFTPVRTKRFEKMIAEKTKFQMMIKETEPFAGPIEIGMVFEIKKPKKTKLFSPRPDLDNLVKAIQDALNGIAFKDDQQIVILAACKEWSDRDCISVTIQEI